MPYNTTTNNNNNTPRHPFEDIPLACSGLCPVTAARGVGHLRPADRSLGLIHYAGQYVSFLYVLILLYLLFHSYYSVAESDPSIITTRHWGFSDVDAGHAFARDPDALLSR